MGKLPTLDMTGNSMNENSVAMKSPQPLIKRDSINYILSKMKEHFLNSMRLFLAHVDKEI